MTHIDAAEDSLATLAQARYRAPYPLADETLNETIALMLRHKSVRKYTSDPVSDHDLDLIITAAQSASTSSNTQAWSVIAIRDKARLKRIGDMIGGRDYVENCAVFLVWVADYSRLEHVLTSNGSTPVTFDLIENTLVSFTDIGISSQSALLAAESLGLGGVFVGGLRNNPTDVTAELGIPHYAFPALGLSIGHPDPSEGHGIKPRLTLETVLHHETYNNDAWEDGVKVYEKNYQDYYAEQGTENMSWMKSMISRLGTLTGLSGRENMHAKLVEQGLDSN